MAILTQNTNWENTFTLTKLTESVLTLSTTGLYVDRNIKLIMNVQGAIATANTATANAVLYTTDGSNGGINISNVIGAQATTEPTTGYYIAMTASGSGSSKITLAGWINTGNLATASSSGVKYFPITTATYSVTGGGLTASTGYGNLSNSGYYNGTSYDTNDTITLATTEQSGYYKIVASGYGKVSRAAIKKLATQAGYLPADSSASQVSAATTGTSNTGTTSYYIKKSTLSATAVTSSASDLTVTISAGYYPSDRTVTINKMTTVTPSTSYANTNMSTYFNTGTSSNNDVSITPRYSNSAGYVSAHTNTNNGGIGYWKIKTTAVTQEATSVSGTTATRGSASWGTGWITEGNIAAATFANSATDGVTYTDISNTTSAPILDALGYLYINQGYTDNLRISLAKLIPDDANVSASNLMLNGVTAYDKDGKLWTGNILTRTASNISFNGKTVTVTAGYYASNTTKDMGLATITSGSATVSTVNYNYDSSNGNFTVTGSTTIGAPTVGTAGYISSSEGTKNTNTATVNTAVAKIAGTVSIGGTKTYTPIISRTNTTASGATNVGVEAATTTAPTSGYFVSVLSAKKTGNVSATASISTAGYGTSANHGITGSGNVEVGANASSITYIPIAGATVSLTGGAISGSVTNITGSNVTLSDTNNGISVTGAASAGRAAVTYDGAVNGWVSLASGTTAFAGTSSNTTLTSKTRYITKITVPKDKVFELETTADTALDTTSDVTITNNAYRLLKITTSGNTDAVVSSTTAGTIAVLAYPKGTGTTIVAKKTIIENGRWAADSGVITPSPTSLSGPYYGEIYVAPMSSGTAASISSEGSVTTAPSVTLGIDTAATATTVSTTNSGSYFITIKGTAGNGTVATKWKNATAGYAALNTSGTAGSSVTVTPSIVDNNKKIYIPAATGTVTMSKGNGSCTLQSSSNVTTSDTNTSGVSVTFRGSGAVSATVATTAGYAPATATFATGASTSSNTKDLTKYITGVTLTAGKTFSITVPNGSASDTITFVFTVDANNNVTVAGPD